MLWGVSPEQLTTNLSRARNKELHLAGLFSFPLQELPTHAGLVAGNYGLTPAAF